MARRPCSHASRDGERSQLGFDQRRGLERLFVAGSRRGLTLAASEVPGEAELAFVEPTLVAEPPERIQCALGEVGSADCSGA